MRFSSAPVSLMAIMSLASEGSYPPKQLYSLVALRLLIAWHLLYEGVSKLANPDWTAAAYLSHAEGPLAGLFGWMASVPSMLAFVDFLNAWGLTLVGLGLLLGLFAQRAAFFGAVILALYVLSNPVTWGVDSKFPAEGSYLFVSKTMIEMVALYLLSVFPTSMEIGFDRIVQPRIEAFKKQLSQSAPAKTQEAGS